jgi:hypothetical protein
MVLSTGSPHSANSIFSRSEIACSGHRRIATFTPSGLPEDFDRQMRLVVAHFKDLGRDRRGSLVPFALL